MRKVAFECTGLFLLFSPILLAVPDPRDSIILESKVVAAGLAAPNATDTSALVYLKVWITNKDSLSNISLPFQEKSLSNGAYLIAGRPRNFNGTVSRLTTTLPTNLTALWSRYNSSSPDSATISAFFDPTNPEATSEPPNVTRKAFWELKFDSTIVNPGKSGLVEFDTIKILSVTVQFVDKWGVGPIRPNFVKAVVGVGNAPFFLSPLISPPNGIFLLQRRPTFMWHSLLDSSFSAIPAQYKVFLDTDSLFPSPDTSPLLPDTVWTPQDTLSLGQHFWKVMAVTDSNDTIFSEEKRTFHIVVNNPPSLFSLIAPANASGFVKKAIPPSFD